ncbi:hypothetical protein [Evtepia sp.]|uniref:hypothetical protein n=1 Tax=Evtepia sp. TaxID=2773933 RepID=UPI002A7ED047|nr:hypothetical protein [Evtepia sp.]MDY4429637.1 hypothetical protein [Evtepia sp.]
MKKVTIIATVAMTAVVAILMFLLIFMQPVSGISGNICFICISIIMIVCLICLAVLCRDKVIEDLKCELSKTKKADAEGILKGMQNCDNCMIEGNSFEEAYEKKFWKKKYIKIKPKE